MHLSTVLTCCILHVGKIWDYPTLWYQRNAKPALVRIHLPKSYTMYRCASGTVCPCDLGGLRLVKYSSPDNVLIMEVRQVPRRLHLGRISEITGIKPV